MKVLVILMLLSGLMGMSFVQAPLNSPEGIDFLDISFQEALKKAKKEKKLIFIDIHAVWCNPCKWMEANTFREKEVGDVFNKEFVNLKINLEEGDGPELASKYNIKNLPTLLLVDGDGKVVKRIIGLQKKNQLLSEVEELVNFN